MGTVPQGCGLSQLFPVHVVHRRFWWEVPAGAADGGHGRHCMREEGAGAGERSPEPRCGAASAAVQKPSLRKGCGRSDALIWRLSSVEVRVVDGLQGRVPSCMVYSSECCCRRCQSSSLDKKWVSASPDSATEERQNPLSPVWPEAAAWAGSRVAGRCLQRCRIS